MILKHWRDRLFYFILVVSMTGMIIHSYSLIDRFVSKPVSTELKYNTATGSSNLPEIMLCNSVPVVFNAFMNNTEKARIYKKFDKAVKGIKEMIEDQVTQLFAIRATLKNSELVTKRYGISFKEFVLHCTFNGQPCDEDDFTIFQHDNYLNCYNFRPKKVHFGVTSTVRMILLTTTPWDTPAGWDHPIGTWRFDSQPVTDYSSGAMVFIHPEGTYPHNRYKVDAAAGTESFIKLDQTIVNTLNLPAKPCVDPEDHKVKYLDLDGDKELIYIPTVDDCLLEAYLQQIMKRCGCLPTKLMTNHTRLDENGNKRPFCFDVNDKTNGTQVTAKILEDRLKCYEDSMNLKQDLDLNETKTSCENSCTMSQYQKEMYTKVWPNGDAVIRTLKHYLGPLMEYSKKNNISGTFAHDLLEDALTLERQEADLRNRSTSTREKWLTYSINLMKMQKIFYENFLKLHITIPPTATVISESLAYEAPALLSDFAGIIGMYLGLSSFSLLELWDSISEYRNKRKEKQKQQEKKNAGDVDESFL